MYEEGMLVPSEFLFAIADTARSAMDDAVSKPGCTNKYSLDKVYYSVIIPNPIITLLKSIKYIEIKLTEKDANNVHLDQIQVYKEY
jgi:hypothetical protein